MHGARIPPWTLAALLFCYACSESGEGGSDSVSVGDPVGMAGVAGAGGAGKIGRAHV